MRRVAYGLRCYGYLYLSEVENVVVGVRHLADKEVTVEQPNLVELVLIHSVVNNGIGRGFPGGDEAVGGDHGDVALLCRRWPQRRLDDGGEEAVVVDVVVLLVVDVVVLADPVRVVRVEVAEVVVHVAIAVRRRHVAPAPR